MSHIATAWAISQRGLSPSQKIVLWALADCHNPARGCFPSQEYLCDITELSERTVRDCILILEEKQIIIRERINNDDGSRHGTRYYLAFENLPANSADRVEPTGKKASTYRQKSVNLPANSAGIYIDEPCKEPVIEPVRDFSFEECWKTYPHVKGRSCKKKSLEAYKKLSNSSRMKLLSCISEYNGALTKRDMDFVPAFERWIRDCKFEQYEPEEVKAVDRGSMVVFFKRHGIWDSAWGDKPTKNEIESINTSH